MQVADFFRQKQVEMNKPAEPREPLKRTAGNNWVHVLCAVWTAENRFGNASALEPCEGIGTIPSSKYAQACKICKKTVGAPVNCQQCHIPVHITCAQQAGYVIGFDITPVKSSRRDLVTTVTVGNETGSMIAAVWCKDHAPKTTVHSMDEVVDDTGLTALQLFVRTYKQADLALTGTVRKAMLAQQSSKAVNSTAAAATGPRRSSSGHQTNGTSATPYSATRGSQRSPVANGVDDDTEMTNGLAEISIVPSSLKKCQRCGIDVSPRWWKIEPPVVKQKAPVVIKGEDYHRQGSQPPAIASSSSTAAMPGSPEAIAAAALTVDTATSTMNGTRVVSYLCHSCHLHKKLSHDLTPPREISQPLTPSSIYTRAPAINSAREYSIPPSEHTRPVSQAGPSPQIKQTPPPLASQIPPQPLPPQANGHHGLPPYGQPDHATRQRSPSASIQERPRFATQQLTNIPNGYHTNGAPMDLHNHKTAPQPTFPARNWPQSTGDFPPPSRPQNVQVQAQYSPAPTNEQPPSPHVLSNGRPASSHFAHIMNEPQHSAPPQQQGPTPPYMTNGHSHAQPRPVDDRDRQYVQHAPGPSPHASPYGQHRVLQQMGSPMASPMVAQHSLQHSVQRQPDQVPTANMGGPTRGPDGSPQEYLMRGQQNNTTPGGSRPPSQSGSGRPHGGASASPSLASLLN
jgi:PHD-zinc-finger like domain